MKIQAWRKPALITESILHEEASALEASQSNRKVHCAWLVGQVPVQLFIMVDCDARPMLGRELGAEPPVEIRQCLRMLVRLG